jgi:tetratricopeptide (TPR) repeat protein
MHDLLRVYAHERAVATVPDHSVALGRVLELFVAVAWRGMTPVPGGVRHAWADESWTAGAPEFDGSAEVFAWLDEHRFQLVEIAETPGMPAESVVRLSVGLFWYYLSRGYWLDWTRIATAALDAAGRGADRFAEALVRMDLGIATAYLARARSSEPGEGLAHLRRSLADFRALGQRRAVAACLINLGDIHELAGDLEAAIARNEESLAISRELGDIPGAEATTCVNLGRLHGSVGDRERQLDHYRRSLRINESIGYDRGSAAVLHLIGAAHRAAGRHDEAEAALRRSIALCREIGDPITEAAAWEELGALHLDRRDPAVAADALRRGLELAEDYDDHRRQATIRQVLRRIQSRIDS